jgi:hypothetical protein
MDPTTHRLLAASAIAGGLLRIASSFAVSALDPKLLEILYGIIDLLLLLGLAGILLTWRGELQRLGYAGVAVAAIGLTVIRATAFSKLAMSGYAIGAGIATLGVALLSADLLWRRAGTLLAPLFWLAAFVLALASVVVPNILVPTLAGIAFGAGFVFAGIDLLTAKTERAAPG